MKKKIIIIPSRNLDIVIAKNWKEINKTLKNASDDTEILRIHLDLSGIFTEKMTAKEAKEKIDATGIDLTIC